jgi:acyl-CoA synthetase (AMP-forming)/AMP-acid ligase II
MAQEISLARTGAGADAGANAGSFAAADGDAEADAGLASVAQAFEQAAARWPGAEFVDVLPETAAVYGIPAGPTTYAQLQGLIARQRAAYALAGYGAGHRVGLLLDNRPAFFLHWFALNGLGVSVVPINADLRAAELEYLVGHSEIALAVALPHRHADLAAAAQAAGRTLALMAGGALEVDSAPPSAPFPPPAASAGTAAPTLTTECALLYTSGTTGRPKGCILPNRYFLHSGAWYAAVGGLAALQVAQPPTTDGQGSWVQDRMLTPLPLVHMNAMAYSVLAMVLTGGCLIVLDRFHPGSWWDSVRASRATVVHYLGVMPSMLMKAAPADADRAHHVRFGFGAGVDRALHAPFEARFGFPLLEAWAMTETGAGAVVMAHREPRQVGSNCFGREGEDVQVRLVADHGGEAGVDEPGELWVRHAGDDPRDGFFAGYLKDPEATAEAWAEGWFHTGDIVRRCAAGQLHFIDRRKNVIRRSGENISAVEVESVLNQHPAVKACAVAATPDAVRGDEVLACIVTHEPVPEAQRYSLARDITEHTLQRLAYYKAPGWVAFVEGLPLTASNKIQRGELKAWAQALPGQAHCVDTRALKKRRS